MRRARRRCPPPQFKVEGRAGVSPLSVVNSMTATEPGYKQTLTFLVYELCPMRQWAKLQLIGPVAIFCAVVAAEAAMYALAQSPSSEALWYINVELFGAFRRSHHFLSSQIDVPYLQFLVALPLICLALVGLAAKNRLMLAISSNLSFVYASFLVYSWFNIANAPRTASLAAVAIPTGPDFYMYLILLGSALVSFFISHVVYFGALRARP